MSLPRRLNLVDVEFKALARKDRVPTKDRPYIDPTFKRPRGKKVWTSPDDITETISVRAQVYFARQDEKNPSVGGDSPITDGNLTFKKAYWDTLNIKPQKGDLIVSIAEEEVKYEVAEVRSAGYLRGKPTLKMVFFERPQELIGNI